MCYLVLRMIRTTTIYTWFLKLYFFKKIVYSTHNNFWIHSSLLIYSPEILNFLSHTFLIAYLYLTMIFVEPSGIQALKNPNPLKDVEAFVVLGVAVLV